MLPTILQESRPPTANRKGIHHSRLGERQRVSNSGQSEGSPTFRLGDFTELPPGFQ
jgi:hypothetical protein